MGVEPSAFASAFARERLDVDVRTGGLFDTELPAERFAAVTMGDLTEHFVRPGAALDRVGGYSRAAAGALVGAAKAAGVADRIWAPDFHDRMMVIARGPAAGG
jgi:hypothetical protein